MARRPPHNDEQQVRLGFQLFASDNPLLVADLLNFHKGKLRHARLVTLATIGLLMERRAIVGEVAPVSATSHATLDGGDDPEHPPLTDEELDIN
jgi:hypothetical protein